MTHNLSLGIYLEDIGELLPWGTPLGELYNIANPIVQKGRDVIRLYWNNHSILGGIKSQIEASFYMNRPDLLDFPNAKGTLEMVSLNFYNSEQIHARQQHQQLKDKSSFAPSESRPLMAWAKPPFPICPIRNGI